MGDLINLLRQGTDVQKEGALQVVVELMKETLDEDQLPAITSELLPVLLEMVNDERVRTSQRDHDPLTADETAALVRTNHTR